MVEAFPAQGSDEAFGDGVRAGCPDRGADDADVGTGEQASKAAVNMLDRSRIKNTHASAKAALKLLSRSRIRDRNRSPRSPRPMSRLRACWVTQSRTNRRGVVQLP